ncbi:hypothetical protein BYT27DRAFT_7241020 [Phlegmacium glaucopus]|nr:hypothetical protein BYT27DRAFT_7241020 [Phlegmacium glaucopus]
MGGLISAISQMNQLTALSGAKVFLVSTGLVAAVSGITLTWVVKTTLGVEEAIPPETDDEYYEVQAPVSSAMGEEWDWAEAEERLNKVYEEGGITIWAQTALRELEAEARTERNERAREQEAVSIPRKKDPSLD